MQKVKWLDRRLIECPFYYGLCTSEKAFDREMKKMKIPARQWPRFPEPGKAKVSFFDRGGDEQAVIVSIGDVAGLATEQVYALLVHEAVHIWQHLCEVIQEDRPSSEFSAYGIQMLSQQLMVAYKESKRRK